MDDGLAKSSITSLQAANDNMAVPGVLPNDRLRLRVSSIELFSDSISAIQITFYEIVNGYLAAVP